MAAGDGGEVGSDRGRYHFVAARDEYVELAAEPAYDFARADYFSEKFDVACRPAVVVQEVAVYGYAVCGLCGLGDGVVDAPEHDFCRCGEKSAHKAEF